MCLNAFKLKIKKLLENKAFMQYEGYKHPFLQTLNAKFTAKDNMKRSIFFDKRHQKQQKKNILILSNLRASTIFKISLILP